MRNMKSHFNARFRLWYSSIPFRSFNSCAEDIITGSPESFPDIPWLLSSLTVFSLRTARSYLLSDVSVWIHTHMKDGYHQRPTPPGKSWKQLFNLWKGRIKPRNNNGLRF